MLLLEKAPKHFYSLAKLMTVVCQKDDYLAQMLKSCNTHRPEGGLSQEPIIDSHAMMQWQHVLAIVAGQQLRYKIVLIL
jgi:hypothetical protein